MLRALGRDCRFAGADCRSVRLPLALVALMVPLLLLVTASRAADAPPTEPPDDWGPLSSTLEEVDYPHPVQYMDLRLFGKDLKLAFMDVPPVEDAEPADQAVMLFHGLNFAGYAAGVTIDRLTEAGFRVIVPDRIGFGRSSKADIRSNFNVKASNARKLLEHLEIDRAAVVGHSMGGMVATRFALLYPDATTHLVTVNQIGLTDSRPGRPWRDHEELYRQTLETDYPSILAGHQRYYPQWDDAYLEWVRIQYGQTLTSEWPKLARIRAWQRQIIYADPVVYDWQHIDTRTLIIGGEEDGLADDWAGLARHAAESFPNAELVLFSDVGHNPQFEIPDRFHEALIRFLRSDPVG